MLPEGRVIKDFNYMVVMGSPVLGNFVIYPNSGSFQNQTIAIEVLRNTLISIGGITRPAEEFNLPELIRFPVLAIVDVKGQPPKIDTGGTWTAIAQYSTTAEEITLKIQ